MSASKVVSFFSGQFEEMNLVHIHKHGHIGVYAGMSKREREIIEVLIEVVFHFLEPKQK